MDSYTPGTSVTTEDTPEMKEGRMLVARSKLLEAQAKESRRKYDWEWMVRTLYVRGYHFGRYNRGTNTVVFSTRTGVKIPINLVAAHMRGVRNQVTSFQPKWEVLPKVTTDRAFDNARYSGKVLDYIYDAAQIKRKIKEVVSDALIYSIGIWHFDINKDKDIIINRIDPFDFWVDPHIKSPNLNDPEYGAEYVILTTQVSIDMVKKNPEYENTEGIETDNLTASAEYKRFLNQVTRNEIKNQKEVNQTIILKQAWIRERQDDGEIKMRFLVYVEGKDQPLYNKLLDDPDYPFEIIQGDIAGGELYGEAWVKNIIPINRVIDALESYIFEYNHLFAKGKWITDKNSGVTIIVNQNGQIIEKNRGSTVEPVSIPPLPSTPMEQIGNMTQYLADLSGVHEISLGRFPSGVKSGTAIAELKQSDATNQADLVDNMQDFLARSGKKILKMISQNWTTTKLVSVTNLVGNPEYFMAIGQSGSTKQKKFKFGDRELPLAVIGEDNEVRVQIGSWLAYTKEARQEKLKELYRLGAIDQQTYLQHAEFADIDGIIQRTRQEQVLEQRSGSAAQSVQKQFGIQIDEQSLALAENELMNEGMEQHAEAHDDHELHMLIHKEEADNDLVKEHIVEHMQYQKWQQNIMSRPNPQMMAQPMGQPGMPPPGAGMPPPPPGVGGQPPTFPMVPPRGPGAPPFNPGTDMIQGGQPTGGGGF